MDAFVDASTCSSDLEELRANIMGRTDLVGGVSMAYMENLCNIYDIMICLVVEVSTPLKNMSSSIGRMKFPTEWKNNNVPNHQPEIVS